MASTLNADTKIEAELVADAKKQIAASMAEDADDHIAHLPSGDVTCQDIAQFFDGRFIFLTGATGFVGKVGTT